MREAIDDAVAVMVAAAAVPVSGVRTRIGAQLDHSEGIGGPGERVPVRVGPDKGIDKGQQGDKQGQEHYREASSSMFWPSTRWSQAMEGREALVNEVPETSTHLLSPGISSRRLYVPRTPSTATQASR